MARSARLSLPGVAHYVVQRGHNGGAIVRDARDADALLQTLREAARLHRVVLHAYGLTATELHLLATPETAEGISRMMQAIGRRHAAAFNRRHGRSGALWDGRFRSALIEPGRGTLLALRQIDGLAATPQAEPDGALLPGVQGGADGPVDRSSLAHRTGGRRDAALVDPAAYWQLGNTPFERESRYRQLVAEPLAAPDRQALAGALRGGRAFGSPVFVSELERLADRPLTPRPRGRPRRSG
jgi:putative transposase